MTPIPGPVVPLVPVVPVVPVSTLSPLSEGWYAHLFNVGLSLVAFVGVVVHPGWHPPVIVVEIIAVAAPVSALLSGLVLMLLHHHLTVVATLRAAVAYVRANSGPVVAAVETADPALRPRLELLEAQLPDAALLRQTLEALSAHLTPPATPLALVGQPVPPAALRPPGAA